MNGLFARKPLEVLLEEMKGENRLRRILGLVPRSFFADVHTKLRTPWKSTILIGAFVIVLSGLLPIDALLHLTNIGSTA
jgi:APA family basic amino acid/polyamine antiporter